MDTIYKIKGDIEHDTCKGHSARTEKDQYRISLSKLSKKELEDVYYSLIDNNLHLKKTINTQQDQIKLLSTRINRMTTQKSVYGVQNGCCKVALNEHKDIILDLKQVNEKLVERVRLLNMQLCSAKQFVKRSPLQTTRCQNCVNIRNSSYSTLNAKRSQATLRVKSTSSQYVDKDVTPLILEETLKDSMPDQVECTQNKCRTMIEELQQEIANLQKELSTVREECTRKLTDVEQELTGLKEENLRVRTQARVSDDNLQLHKRNFQELLKKLRILEAQSELQRELIKLIVDTASLELTLERQRARELQAELRAAEISHTIVEALSHANNTSIASVRLGETPSKVDQSDDSGYLEITQHKEMECGGGDNKLYEIDERQITMGPDVNREPTEHTNTKENNNYRAKKRKEKNKRNKRNGPTDVPFVDEIHENILSSKDTSETNVFGTFDKGTDDKERIDHKEIDLKEDSGKYTDEIIEIRKIYRDVGVQSAEDKKYVSRGVGDALKDTRTIDAGVQIGDSLCAMNDIDTKTYSRRSAKSRTYSVEAKPKKPARDNTESEISSLSDLPTERDSNPSHYISPGEQVSSSRSDDDATSSDELSEGEMPVSGNKRSYGEVDVNGRIAEDVRAVSPSIRVEQAIKAVKEELTRCNQLLEDRTVDPTAFPFNVNPFVLFRSRDASRL